MFSVEELNLTAPCTIVIVEHAVNYRLTNDAYRLHVQSRLAVLTSTFWFRQRQAFIYVFAM